MAEITEIIYWVCAVMVIVASLLAILRIAVGPSVLDRAIALDLLTAVAIAVVVLVVAWWGRTDLAVLLAIFALTGFFSSVAVSRFAAKESADDRVILTREQAQARALMQQREEERRIRTEAALAAEQDDEEEEERPLL